ncbi:hypothetical protein FEMY_23420 [Ferrovum myxofaciens]|uniref:Uncharacterized protein n=1 Tax=Ferrovum myxofaciens TaxID=416213 RepID=A0A149VVC5_9PROT|nr:hypothetical protein [Ferrovum myxofaciens]KXW57136.1 hypothetical protein FEMY_23420 [Ferrovum myxofaciens]
MSTSTGKNAGVNKLLESIRPQSTQHAMHPEHQRVIVQEARPVRKMGRPVSASTAGVQSVKVSPAIPLALKRKVDMALAEPLADEFPTLNDFAAAAFRLLLESRHLPTDFVK